jgi:hypothetical protein
MIENYFKASVGKGCANSIKDVALIQQLLTCATYAIGQTYSPGKIDGLLGPKTINSINQYQRLRSKVIDGRIDPGHQCIRNLVCDAHWGLTTPRGRTLLSSQSSFAALNGSLFMGLFDLSQLFGPNSAELARSSKGFSLLPLVVGMAKKSLEVCSKIQISFASADEKALLRKHFSPRNLSATAADSEILTQLPRITLVYAAVMLEAIRRSKKPETNGDLVGQDKLELQDGSTETTFLAETEPGGIYYNNPKIFLGPPIEKLSSEAFAVCILHEICHAVGQPKGAPFGVKIALPDISSDLYMKDRASTSASVAARTQAPTPYEMFAIEATYGTAKAKFHTDVDRQMDRTPTIGPLGVT